MTDRDELHQQLPELLARSLNERTGWDEPPELLGVFTDKDGALEAEPFPVPDLLWELDEPAVVLALYATAVAGQLKVDPDLVAIAFRAESYTIDAGKDPRAAEVLRRRLAGGSALRNEQVPGRIEQRVIFALSLHGRHFIASADRREDGTAAPAVAKAHPEGEAPLGLIPRALTALMDEVHPQRAARP